MNGVFQTKSTLDTMTLISTDIINGQEYYILNNYPLISIDYTVIDSSGYLLNSSSQIVYSPNDNDGVLYETIIDITTGNSIKAFFEMGEADELITPLGAMEVRALVGKFDFSQSLIDCDKEFRSYYSQGIGLVRSEAFYATNCRLGYSELVDYRLN